MQREQFLQQPDVSSFIDWLVSTLPTQTFHIYMRRSRFVPGGLDVRATGLEDVLQHYTWQTSWNNAAGAVVASGSWEDTRQALGQLRAWLKRSVAQRDEDQTLEACLAILRWGGVRGSIVFLKRLHAEKRLVRYFSALSPLMSLTSDTPLDALDMATVERFDAGLTKIHALLDDSGSPIYDSRVGAAMAMLYALYRQQCVRPVAKKRALAFPSGAARGRQIRNPKGIGDAYAGAPQFFSNSVSSADWAQWQRKLGWIIRATLERCDWFATEPDMPARCHAFEAALFMLGYDLRCFGITGTVQAAPEKVAENDIAQTGWVPTGCSFEATLPYYAAFRKTGLADNKASFSQWYASTRRKALKTAEAYCFPYGEQEFDLFGSADERLARVLAGGEPGLYAAVGDAQPYAEGTEREQVCLVDAMLVGKTAALSAPERAQWLMARGYAGTVSAASTLYTVGSQVGKHFGLLDKHGQPTEFYHCYFASCAGPL